MRKPAGRRAGEEAGLPEATEPPAPGSSSDLGRSPARPVLPRTRAKLRAVPPFPSVILRGGAYCPFSPPPPPPPSQRLYPGRSLRLRRRRERDLSYVTKIGRDGARSEVPWSSQAHPSEQRTATPPRPALGSRGSAPAVQAPGSSSVVLAFAFGTRPQVPPERPSPRPGPRRGTPGPPLTVVGGVRRET